jgi:hypothetical protein
VLVLFIVLKFIRILFRKTTIGNTYEEIKNLTGPMFRNLMFASIGLIGMQAFLTWGAMFTIMSHADLYSSLCAIIIVFYRLITR